MLCVQARVGVRLLHVPVHGGEWGCMRSFLFATKCKHSHASVYVEEFVCACMYINVCVYVQMMFPDQAVSVIVCLHDLHARQ